MVINDAQVIAFKERRVICKSLNISATTHLTVHVLHAEVLEPGPLLPLLPLEVPPEGGGQVLVPWNIAAQRRDEVPSV